MARKDFPVQLSRRDRSVFQYPPFETMHPGQLPDFSTPMPESRRAGNGVQLYLHIPFCRVRCTFCYYSIIPNTFRTVVNPYVDALHKEIEMVSELSYLQDREVETIYFGGGTPTYLEDDQLESLILHLKKHFRFSPQLEFTCEGEPTTITESKLRLLKDLGVNRMSFGIQSFHWEVAHLNGRIAKPDVVSRALEWAKETDFRVMNIDLMSGMLDETLETWEHSLNVALSYEPEHLTIYRMEIKPGTQLFSKLQLDPEFRKKFVGDELELEMVRYAEQRLAGAGYQHNSHYSWIPKPEFDHTHRANCWRGKDLICIGESAFGYANGYLYQNASHYRPYGKLVTEGKLPIYRSHKLSQREMMISYMVMGFKLLNINRAAFKERFEFDPLQAFPDEVSYLQECGAVDVTDTDIKATSHGCLYADSFVRVFYPPEHIQMDEIAVGTPAFDRMPVDMSIGSELLTFQPRFFRG